MGVVSLVALGCNEQPEERGRTNSDTAAGSLEGTITLEGRDDYSGILVTAGSSAGTETDESGSFRLEGVPAGERVVEASRSGFEARQAIVEIKTGSTANIEWELASTESDDEPANRPPQLASLSAPRRTLPPGGTVEVTAEASDPDGDELAYSWSATGNYQVEQTSEANVATVQAPDETGQSGRIQVRIQDGNGGGIVAAIEMTTSTNSPPVVTSLSANPPQLERGGSATLQATASDPDGDDLSYDWSVDSSDWSIEGEGESVTLQGPDRFGASTTVTLSVSDGRGASTSTDLSVSTARSAGSPVISSLTASPSSVEPRGAIQLQVSASDPDGESLSYTWQAPSEWSLTENTDSAQVVAPDEPDQRASIAVTATSESGQQASASVFVSTQANRAPVVASIVATPNPVEPGATTTVDVSASDSDGDALSYSWTEPSDWTRQSASNDELVLEAPDTYDASGTLEVEIDDGRATTQTSVTLSTISNLAPTISNLSAQPSPVSQGGTVQLAASANDPNGDDLTYTWSVGNSDWTLQSTGGSSTALDAPDQAGSSTSVTLTVEDGAGGQAEASTSVATLDCGANRGNCDGSATNGCETNLMSNASHCGACGQSCSSGANAQSVCFGGACDVQCATGFADCDGDPSNGCEVDLNADDANCGSCGNTCGGFANATSTCQNGQCQLNCKSGFANCDGRVSNGCEVDLSSNDDHCGQCGNVCGSASNGDRICQNGQCELTCNSGFKDCDGNPANGCEPAGSGSTKVCAGRTCNTILQGGYAQTDGVYWLDPDGGQTDDAFEAYCDMTTDGGGWTLLGTISGQGADVWAEKKGPWADQSTFGSPNRPYRDYKSRAWFELDVSNSDILWQRRYEDQTRGQVVLQNCLRGKDRFNKLFATWAPRQQGPSCKPSDMRTLAGSSEGVERPQRAEGQSQGLGGSQTNGLCWNGGDDNGNTYRGHLYWSDLDGSGCVQRDHIAAIAIWRNGDGQYSNADITGTNWMYRNVNFSEVDISLFAR